MTRRLANFFAGTGTAVSVDTVKAVHEFTLNYPHWGTANPMAYDATVSTNPATHVKYDLPVKITWEFINGVDYPLWSVEYDFSGIPVNVVYSDMRGPYGNMKFDNNGSGVVTGLEWGDKYLFTATPVGGGITTGSSWDWSEANLGARYNLLVAGDYEMGIVQNTAYPNSTLGSGWSDDRGKTSNQQAGCGAALMPCDWEWAYQSIQYGLNANLSNNKKLAWGSAPFVGSDLTQVYINNTETAAFSGYPKMAYSVWLTFDKSGGVKTRNLAIAGGQIITQPQAPSGTPFVGYYPSWLNNPAKSLNQVSRTFSHVFLAFAFPDVGTFNAKTRSFNGTGLGFTQPVAEIRNAIANLQRDGIKVVLSVGGAQAALDAQGHGNGWQNLISQAQYRKRLLLLANALGVDGIDMDYEAGVVNDAATIAQYSKVLTTLRSIAKHMNNENAAGNANPKLFTMAASSVGADCAPANSKDPYCKKLKLNSAWAGAGIERKLLKENRLAKQVDMLNIMSYDIGYYAYDPVLAYQQYRTIMPAGVAVNLGLEVLDSATIGGAIGPEKSVLMVNDADVDAEACPGTVMLNDQYSAIWNFPTTLRPINRPYSVENMANSIKNANIAKGSKDGLMLWSLFRTESENLDPSSVTCNGITAATPESARLRAAEIMGWTDDGLTVE
ncbi:glycosyl hydrolase family 18 protein [Methylocucumis oryzae]|nr:glycosyl hydrolase family 18 protein [Methylocucumis oryzae]